MIRGERKLIPNHLLDATTSAVIGRGGDVAAYSGLRLCRPNNPGLSNRFNCTIIDDRIGCHGEHTSTKVRQPNAFTIGISQRERAKYQVNFAAG